jgi:hypothetical protein
MEETFLLSRLIALLIQHLLPRTLQITRYELGWNLALPSQQFYIHTSKLTSSSAMSEAPRFNRKRAFAKQCMDGTKTTKLGVSENSQIASLATTKVPKSLIPAWSHEPKTLTLLWLAMAIPVVFMDASFILGRPYTFAGGALHSLLGSLWTPWDIYQEVDYVYSRTVFDERDGWPGAQALFNLIETSCFIWYMLSVARYSVGQSDRTADLMDCQLLFAKKSANRKKGIAMAMVLCSAMMITVVKTALYCRFSRFLFPSLPIRLMNTDNI